MSSYTMQLKTYIEKWSQREHGLSHRERIEIGRKKLFDFDYPIFDESYRNVFETHFIRNFYMREIGFETEGLFKFQLETWLVIHMPYFNKLFESELIKYNPLENVKIDITHNKKNETDKIDDRVQWKTSDSDTTANEKTNQSSKVDGESHSDSIGNVTDSESNSKDVTGTKTGEKFNRDLESNNPDSRLAITTNDGQGVIEYASKIDENKETDKENTTNKTVGKNNRTSDEITSNDTTSTVNSKADAVSDLNQKIKEVENMSDKLKSDIHEIEDFIHHKVGKEGTQTYSQMVKEFRESFLRIERQIFQEMQELFMLVY